MIDITKPVQTRDGRWVEGLKIKLGAAWPLVGIIEGSGVECCWQSDGSYLGSGGDYSKFDIFNAPALSSIPAKITFESLARAGFNVKTVSNPLPNWKFSVTLFKDGVTGASFNSSLSAALQEAFEQWQSMQLRDYVFYVNVYERGTGNFTYKTKEDAMRAATVFHDAVGKHLGVKRFFFQSDGSDL